MCFSHFSVLEKLLASFLALLTAASDYRSLKELEITVHFSLRLDTGYWILDYSSPRSDISPNRISERLAPSFRGTLHCNWTGLSLGVGDMPVK